MQPGTARGPNFIYAREWIQNQHGADGWKRILAALPPKAAEVWGGPLLASATYPFPAFKAVLPVLSAQTGVQTDRQLAGMYAHIADRSLNQIYKVFFRATNPAFVIRNYPKLWARFFTEGTVEVPVAERGHAVLRFVLPEIFLDWLPAACLGFSEKAVQMAGGSGLKLGQTEMVLRPDGLWQIEYDLRWSER